MSGLSDAAVGEPEPKRKGWSKYKSVIASAVGVVVIAGGGVVVKEACGCKIPQFPGGGGGGGASNVYVATNGNDGTCVRGNSSLPCLTFDGACAKAQAGDTVGVKSGTYTSGFSISSSCTVGTLSQHVIFQPDTGATVSLNGFMQVGASHITVKDFTWCCQTSNSTDDSQQITVLNGAADDLLQNLDASAFGVYKADNITFKGGDYGPCITNSQTTCEGALFGDNTGVSPGSATNITIDGATIHGMHTSGVLGDCGNPADVCHVVGINCFGCNGITIKNSKFYDNNVDNFFPQNCCGNGDPQNITLINNWFGPINGSGDGNISMSSGGCCANLHIRFNSFTTDVPIFNSSASVYTGFEYVGNIVSMDDPFFCPPLTGTQDRNIFIGNSSDDHCGTNFGTITSGTPYLNTTNSSSMNLHLGGTFTGTSPDNFVPTTVSGGCPVIDIDGQARPINTNCDAGSDER